MKRTRASIIGLVIATALASGLAQAADRKQPAPDITGRVDLGRVSEVQAVELQPAVYMLATQYGTVPLGCLRPWFALVRSLMGHDGGVEPPSAAYLLATQHGTLPPGTLRPWFALVRSLMGY